MRSFVFLGSLAAAAAAFAQTASGPPPSPLPQLAWLAGCWASEVDEAGSGEQWLAPAGGTMLGVSRTIKNGRTVAFEFMQIRDSVIVGLSFVAQPSGRQETTFPMKSLGPDEVVFENPMHGFPQRVLYRRIDADRVLGRVEGVTAGTPRAIDYPLKRAPC